MKTMENSSEFDQKGYTVCRGLISPSDIDDLRNRLLAYARAIFSIQCKDWAELNALMPQLALKHPEQRKFFYDLCQLAPEAALFPQSTAVRKVLSDIGIHNPVLKNMNLRLDVPDSCDFFLIDWHQDLNNLDCERSCTFWVPLHDLDKNSGGLSVLDTNPFEERQWTSSGADEYRQVDISRIPSATENQLYPKAGDAVVFNPYLVHKSLKGIDACRWTVIFRFDCLDTFYQVTGRNRKSPKMTTDDPYLRSRGAAGVFQGAPQK